MYEPLNTTIEVVLAADYVMRFTECTIKKDPFLIIGKRPMTQTFIWARYCIKNYITLLRFIFL